MTQMLPILLITISWRNTVIFQQYFLVFKEGCQIWCRIIRFVVLIHILIVVGFLWSGQEGFFQRILMGYFFAGIPWGWSILTRITPSMFLFMSWFGWLIYFIIKLLLSMLIGMFVTPFKIYKILKGLSDAKDMEAYTKGANTIQ